MNNVRNIVENTLVPHTAFESARIRLEQCFDYAQTTSEPICIALVGESRTGKSRVLEECYANHASIRDSAGLNVPILRVKTPSKPTVKGLAELMLRAMEDPRFDAGTENAKTIRLQTLMKHSGTRMVMIDEFQHFYDKGSRKVMHHVADWMKILVDDSRVALVVAGLPTCRAVLDQNEQLSGRFLSPIVMPRFDWRVAEHREEFIGILGAFQESLGQHFDIPCLDSAELAFRIYCGTGGLIGYLTKFLRQVVWNALDHSYKSITLEQLQLAHDEAVGALSDLPGALNPFHRDFIPAAAEDVLAKVRSIGLPKQEEVRPVRRTTQRKKNTVQTVLSAS